MKTRNLILSSRQSPGDIVSAKYVLGRATKMQNEGKEMSVAVSLLLNCDRLIYPVTIPLILV